MAYIPPHMRHSRDYRRPSPVPELLIPQFRRNLKLRSSDSNVARSGKIMYADHAVSRWFLVGLDDNGQFPCYIHLEPISSEDDERKGGEIPLVLVNSNLPKEDTKLMENISRSPWVTIQEKVQQELLSSFEILRNEMEYQSMERIKPTLVARFGKIRFHGSHSLSLGGASGNQITETVLRQLKRSIYTNIPSSYMENITDKVIPTIGLGFEEEKDIYHVKLSDNTRPDATLSCKCRVLEDKKLVLYKVELNQVRQMVNDISCVNKNLDLRIMLCTKKILTSFPDDEMKIIRDLINSAVLDSDVKGGLRWPLDGASSGERYRVVGVWHTTHKSYENPSLRLKVRLADRYDFRTGIGESTREVYLKLKGIVSALLHGPVADSGLISKMLEDNMRLIWENFLLCDRF